LSKGKSRSKKKILKYIQVHMANMYGSAVCSGKIKPGGKSKTKKRKK
jgi:hypothetical protein